MAALWFNMGKHIHKLSNIDPIKRRADCKACGNIPISPKRNNGRTTWHCKVSLCRWKKGRIGYGYKTGSCKICGKETNKLVQDHDHSSGQLRGWVCLKCNYRIGLLENGKLSPIILYLEEYKKRPAGVSEASG